MKIASSRGYNSVEKILTGGSTKAAVCGCILHNDTVVALLVTRPACLLQFRHYAMDP